MKMYIAMLENFPDYMTPTLIAHSVLSAHLKFQDDLEYKEWLETSFKKVVLRVNKKEFEKIKLLPKVHLGFESNILDGIESCAVVCPNKEIPNVLKFAKIWKPKLEIINN
jgi:hypothetical protein